MKWRNTYDRTKHAAARTHEYLFNQLIPYIGNKRKLLDLIQEALALASLANGGIFLDLFAGSGVVSRLAKQLGHRVISNDWEPYTHPINTCYIACNGPPEFKAFGGYERVIQLLNDLPPRVDWVTEHLCPQDDADYDSSVDRMFYMRKNGVRIDAIRHQIHSWRQEGSITDREECCLLAPVLYQACYRSNTSGVFKAFHKGWGGQTRTALYRIATDLRLMPAVFYDSKAKNVVFCKDAQSLAEELSNRQVSVAYLDPPYNQHPYGSNYHVLNSITLWDKPQLSKRITRGTKAAIRKDWRTERRSAYNDRRRAASSYVKLLKTLNARYILTSYSTDATIRLDDMLLANVRLGRVRIALRGYKRYRVSSQRFSEKPMNVEFVLVLEKDAKSDVTVEEIRDTIAKAEEAVLENHPEQRGSKQRQLPLF